VIGVRRWLPVVVAFVVIVGMVTAVASGTSAIPSGRQFSSAPPSGSSSAPVGALVDATGAAILLPRTDPAGLQVVGIRRGVGVAWRVNIPDGVTPIGCVHCPTVAVSDRRGRLGEISNGRLRWLAPVAEPLSDAIGLPGFAPGEGPAVLATTAGPASLRLRLLGRRGQSLRTTVTSPGAVLPLTRFQQANAEVTVSASDVAAGIASVDALRPGQWRVVESTHGRTVLDTVEPANLATIDDARNITACVSPEGTQTAFVVPDGRRLDVLSGRTGARLRRRHLPVGGGVLGCDVTDTTVSVASTPDPQGESNAVVLTRLTASGAVHSQRLPLPIESIQFCPGTGELVTEGPAGTTIARPGHRLEILREAQLAGCTVDGTAWFVHGRAISWIAGHR
jgi:hypothetical protein